MVKINHLAEYLDGGGGDDDDDDDDDNNAMWCSVLRTVV